MSDTAWVWICGTILLIAFYGEPDLMDVIIARLQP